MVEKSSYFFYGTLRDPDILSLVAGEASLEKWTGRAVINDYKAVYVIGEQYPILIPLKGHQVEGDIYSSLSKDEIDSLDHYEGDEYEVIEIEAITSSGDSVKVKTYYPKSDRLASSIEWDLLGWEREFKEGYLGSLAVID